MGKRSKHWKATYVWKKTKRKTTLSYFGSKSLAYRNAKRVEDKTDWRLSSFDEEK